MSLSIINQDVFVSQLGAKLREEMLLAAEPIIKEALSKAETEMRKRLAEMVVGMIETSYDVFRDGRDMHIKVRMGSNP